MSDYGDVGSAPADAGGEGGGDNGQAEFFAQMQGEVESAKNEGRQARDELARIRRAISGEKETKTKTKWADPLLDQVLAASEKGNKMPLTAATIMQTQELLDRYEAQQAEVAELKAALAELRNPAAQQDRMVYANLDNMLANELDRVYEDAPPHLQDAVAAAVADGLKEIQQRYPDKWQEIRLSEVKQRKLVQHFVLKAVPENAKKLMRTAYEQAIPVTASDFDDAWEDAKQIQDPRLRERTMTDLRQRKLEFMHTRRR